MVLLSIAVLWAAPFLYRAASRYTAAHRAVERLLLIALAILIVVDILPASFAVVGWATPVVALLGMLVPSAVERTWRRLATQVHWVPLVIGTLGLALHAFLDGAALVNPFGYLHRVSFLPFAVLLHRFFEGVFIWWALRPRFGWEVAAAVLGFSSSFTLAGWMAASYYFPMIDAETGLAVFQALVAGSLLHLAVDRHDHEHAHAHGQEHAHAHAHGHAHEHGHGGT